jgi:hypothetical protein
MSEKVRTSTMAIATIVAWFMIVTLGFGSQFWPLLAGVH